MALRLKYWVGLVVLSCAVIAVAYLPPSKETVVVRIRARQSDNPARVAQMQMTRQIRELRERRDMALLRDQVLAELDGQDMEVNGPVVLAEAGVSEQLQSNVQRALRTQWNTLGKPSKMNVAMFVRLVRKQPLDQLAPTPTRTIEVMTLLPQVTDGSTCVRVATINARDGVQPRMLTEDFPSYLADYFLTTALGLGPCGFYAAFGEPGETVASWLEEAGYRFAFSPNWDGNAAIRARTDGLHEDARTRDVYSFSPIAFACASGKENACTKVIRGAGGRVSSFTPKTLGNGWLKEPALGRRPRSWVGWNLGGQERFMLSALVAQFGHASFQRFWKTSQPFDVAFAELAGVPAADWSREWVQSQFGVVRAGPLVGTGFTGFVLLVLGISVGLGMFLAARRQY